MSLFEKLSARSNSKCELCSSSQNLQVYLLPPQKEEALEKSTILCETCVDYINNPETQKANHWHCLNDSMWSEVPAVQVLAWRVLKQLTEEAWAQDLLSQLYLDEENLKWAEAGLVKDDSSKTQEIPTKDGNGNTLADGDSVALIKDLDVKGAGFTAKRGTVVKKISLTSNPLHIEGKVNGVQIVIISAYVKKV